LAVASAETNLKIWMKRAGGLFLSSIEEHAVTVESRKYPQAIFDVCQRFIQISRILLS
jgi:hypothetical protein